MLKTPNKLIFLSLIIFLSLAVFTTLAQTPSFEIAPSPGGPSLGVISLSSYSITSGDILTVTVNGVFDSSGVDIVRVNIVNIQASGVPPISFSLINQSNGVYRNDRPIFSSDGTYQVVIVATDSLGQQSSQTSATDLIIGPPPPTCTDNDIDGYGNPGDASCSNGPQADCDDGDPNINPNMAELCNDNLDNDCDGAVDSFDTDCLPPPPTCTDNDGDGYGDPGNDSCSNGPQRDCDDTPGKDYINPDAPETCNNEDDDCDTQIDEGCDDDGDDYCDSAMTFYSYRVDVCPSSNLADNVPGDDCNDTDGNINPSMAEICNDNLDNDCDPNTPDFCPPTCTDNDIDGYGNPGDPSCSNGPQTDCDDGDPNINPGVAEVCNDNTDNDCDGDTDWFDSDCTPPALLATITSLPRNYIQGQLANFDVIASGGIPPYQSYLWNSDLAGDFSTNPNANNIDTTTWPTDIHTITVYVTDSIGQIASDNTTVTIYPVGTLVANINMWGTDFVKDSAWPAAFSVDVTGGTGSYGFVWNSDLEGDFATNQWPLINISSWTTGPHLITVTVTDNNNNIEVSDTITINIIDMLVDIIPADGFSIEQGYDLWFDALITGGTGTFTCDWSSDVSGPIISNDCSGFTRNNLSVDLHNITVTVSAFDTNGNPITASDQHTIQILSLTSVTANITSPSTVLTFNQGQNISFTATAGGGVTPLTYRWESDSVAISTALNFNTNSLSSGPHQITFTATDNIGNVASDTINLNIIIPSNLSASIFSPTNGSSFAQTDQYVTFDGSASGGVPPYTFLWSSDVDLGIGSGPMIYRNDLSVNPHQITLTVRDSLGIENIATTNITVNSGCFVAANANTKDDSKYSNKELFLISDQDWRYVLSMVPLTTWQEGAATRKYPALIFHDEVPAFDADSSIHFMQLYQPDHLTTVNTISDELNNLIIAPPPTGAGINSANITNINSGPADYFSYWSSYESVVLVDYFNYQAGLMASVFAAYKNSPIIFVNSFILDIYTQQPYLNNKTIYIIDGVDSATQNYIDANASCQVDYSLEELQQWYAMAANSDKLILVNPNDLNIILGTNFGTEKNGSIYNLFSKMSLAAPFLAAAKQGVIHSTPLPNTGGNGGCNARAGVTDNIRDADAAAAYAIQNLFPSLPEYLTIIAAPRAIPESQFADCNNGPIARNQVDLKYGSLDDDALDIDGAIADSPNHLNVGRIYGITVADASSNIMSSIYFDQLINDIYGSSATGMTIAHTLPNLASCASSIQTIASNSEYNSVCYIDAPDANCIQDIIPSTSEYQNKRFILFGDGGDYRSWGPTLDVGQIPWLDLSYAFADAPSTNNFWSGLEQTFGPRWIRRGGIAYQGATGYTGMIPGVDDCQFYFSLQELAASNAATVTLGQAHKQRALDSQAIRDTYILLGDPALQLKLPEMTNWP